MNSEGSTKSTTYQTAILAVLQAIASLLVLAYLKKLTSYHAKEEDILLQIVLFTLIDRTQRFSVRGYYDAFATRQKQMLAQDYHTSASRQAVQLFVTGIALSMAEAVMLIATGYQQLEDRHTRWLASYLFVLGPLVLMIRGLATDLWRHENKYASTAHMYFIFYSFFTFFLAIYYYRDDGNVPNPMLAFFVMRYPIDIVMIVVGIFSRIQPDTLVRFDFHEWFPLNYTVISRFFVSTLASSFNCSFAHVQVFIVYQLERSYNFESPVDARIVMYQHFCFVEIVNLCNSLSDAFGDTLTLDQGSVGAMNWMGISDAKTPGALTQSAGVEGEISPRSPRDIGVRMLISYILTIFSVYCFLQLAQPLIEHVMQEYAPKSFSTGIITGYVISQAIRPLQRAIYARFVKREQNSLPFCIESVAYMVTGVLHYVTRSNGEYFHPIQPCLYVDCFRELMYVVIYVLDYAVSACSNRARKRDSQ